MYTDSHCHITCDRLYTRIDEIIENIQSKNVTSCMIMCTSPEELERAKKIKEKYPFFKVAFGWFPSDAKEIKEKEIQYLIDQTPYLDCLGEIGLDYYWDTSFNDLQKELFIKQIQIANKHNLPISIHMRESTKDCMDILKQYAKTKIIFHCFSGSKETMMECLKMNSMISFAGPITFKNARQAPDCIEACPIDRIITETDSPYLTPVPYRGKENEPMYVEYVAKKICEIKQLDEVSACKQIEENFNSIFR